MLLQSFCRAHEWSWVYIAVLFTVLYCVFLGFNSWGNLIKRYSWWLSLYVRSLDLVLASAYVKTKYTIPPGLHFCCSLQTDFSWITNIRRIFEKCKSGSIWLPEVLSVVCANRVSALTGGLEFRKADMRCPKNNYLHHWNIFVVIPISFSL